MTVPIPLYEDFAQPQGQFVNYDTYDATQRTALAAQKHVDIRSFGTVPTEAFTMYALDGSTMTAGDALTMSTLETAEHPTSENWQATRPANLTLGNLTTSNFPGLSYVCSTGTNVLSSVSLGLTVSLVGFQATDYISVALPSLATNLTLSQCFLDISSDATGNFASGQTDSLPFTSSTTTLTGNCEARFPVSLLVKCNKAAIVAVRFRLGATASCTFQCLAIRCLASSWQFANVDVNTLYSRLQRTPPPTGTTTQATTFPTTAISGLPSSSWPILLFSDGATGPAVANVEVGAAIYTGAGTANYTGGPNTFSFYFREYALIPRTMSTVDGLSMAALDGLPAPMDFVPGTRDNFAQTAYLSVTLTWGTPAQLAFADQSGVFATLSPTLANETSYYLSVSLSGNSLRAQIRTITNGTPSTAPVFDSTAFIDPVRVPRRPGRFGWFASLVDGDAYVTHIRPRRVVYGEQRSLPLLSLTPVDGAQLFVSATPPTELVTTPLSALGGTTVTPDTIKSSSGESYAVACSGTALTEGIQTSYMRFENFADARITFDLLATSPLAFQAVLVSPNQVLPLDVPPVPVANWASVTIPLAPLAATAEPGEYAFALVRQALTPTVWYLDHLRVEADAVAWSARAQAATLADDVAWLPFANLINDPYNGVALPRGPALQVRGELVSQTAAISSFRAVPKYAPLGQPVWSDQAPVYPAPPVPAFSLVLGVSQDTLTFDGSASTAAGGILAYSWSFGDGSYGYGEVVSHLYTQGGPTTVTLTVIDTYGQQVSVAQSYSITL